VFLGELFNFFDRGPKSASNFVVFGYLFGRPGLLGRDNAIACQQKVWTAHKYQSPGAKGEAPGLHTVQISCQRPLQRPLSEYA
jgi:hypothetical protein